MADPQRRCGLVGRGRVARRWAGRRALNAGTNPQAQRIARGTLSIARAAFIAQREPWRLTEVTLLEVPESTAPVIASWADEATAVLQGKPAEQHVVAPNENWGDLCVGIMLKPNALHRLVPEPWPERFAVDGPLLEQDPALLPELLFLVHRSLCGRVRCAPRDPDELDRDLQRRGRATVDALTPPPRSTLSRDRQHTLSLSRGLERRRRLLQLARRGSPGGAGAEDPRLGSRRILLLCSSPLDNPGSGEEGTSVEWFAPAFDSLQAFGRSDRSGFWILR